LRSLDKTLIYFSVNSAFVSVASLDSEVLGGCLYVDQLLDPRRPNTAAITHSIDFIAELRKMLMVFEWNESRRSLHLPGFSTGLAVER